MLVCYLVLEHFPGKYEPRFVFSSRVQAEDWISKQLNKDEFDIQQIECRGF